MSEFITQTVYFSKPGPVNTERTLALKRERAEALGIRTVLVATLFRSEIPRNSLYARARASGVLIKSANCAYR